MTNAAWGGDAPRIFETGASRNSTIDKIAYEGFLSPLVLERFGRYMHRHRHLEDGSLRDPDNWQKGIPLASYMDSAWRHFMDMWFYHRGHPDLAHEEQQEALCGLMFNAMGYLHELLKQDKQFEPLAKVGAMTRQSREF